MEWRRGCGERVVVQFQAEETWPEAGDRQMELEAAGAQNVMGGVLVGRVRR